MTIFPSSSDRVRSPLPPLKGRPMNRLAKVALAASLLLVGVEAHAEEIRLSIDPGFSMYNRAATLQAVNEWNGPAGRAAYRDRQRRMGDEAVRCRAGRERRTVPGRAHQPADAGNRHQRTLHGTRHTGPGRPPRARSCAGPPACRAHRHGPGLLLRCPGDRREIGTDGPHVGRLRVRGESVRWTFAIIV